MFSMSKDLLLGSTRVNAVRTWPTSESHLLLNPYYSLILGTELIFS